VPDIPTQPGPPRRAYLQEKLFGCPELHAVMRVTVLADDGVVHLGAGVEDLRNSELMAAWAECSYPLEDLPALLLELVSDVLEVLEVLR